MKKLLLILFLYAIPTFAQKPYEELLVELKDKALKNALEWSDIGDLVDTIEAESDDPKYRAELCHLTLLWLESFLPSTELRSYKRAGRSPFGKLNIAIANGDVASVVRNIAREVHRSYRGIGDGPLHAVMRAGTGPRPLPVAMLEEKEILNAEQRLQALRLLLLCGVELDGRDDDGRTALVHAVLDWPRFVPLLLAAGANPNVADNEGHAGLFYVARSGHKGNTALEMMRKLIRFKANVNAIYETGRTLLGQLAILDRGDLIIELLDNGAHPWILDGEGRTALHWAGLLGSVEAVKALLKHFENRADRLEYVNAKDKNGMTPLMLAFAEIPSELFANMGKVKQGLFDSRFEVASLLIAAGAVLPLEAQTTLDLAILYGVLEPLVLLPRSLIASLSESEKMRLLLASLGRLPVMWEELVPNHKSRRGAIFLVLWRAFETDLTFQQVEELEAAATANGFDIVLEWLLELKAYPHQLTANQKLALLLQLIKPLPNVRNPQELENYRNARRRILEHVLTDLNNPLTPEQAEEIERRGRDNGFEDFFDSPLWQRQRTDSDSDSVSPRRRADSTARRALTMVRRITKSLLPRRGSSGADSSPRTGLPKPDRDPDSDGHGGAFSSITQ